MIYEEILAKMLESVPNTLDKRKGSLMYLALAPVSYALSVIYKAIEKTYDDTFADMAKGEYLTRRCAERGIIRKSATYAVRKGVFNITVPVGSRFGIDKITYTLTEQMDDNEAKLTCEQIGEIGNNMIGDILPITYIKGLSESKLEDILIPGEEIEDDESLKKRYFEGLESESFGGNITDYKQKVMSLQGIGGVKVYPVWNGGGTVKLVVIDSNYNSPNAVLIDLIQTTVDPVINGGEGVGIAPIGHKVTVVGTEDLIVDITSNINLTLGYVWQDVEEYVRDAVGKYLLSLRNLWDGESNLIVRVSQIESAILEVTGVVDIQNTMLNGSLTNLTLTDVQIPISGSVSQI